MPASELEERFKSLGMPEEYAKFLTALDTNVKHGSEDRTNDVVLSVTGKEPGRFKAFAEENKVVWL